MKTHTLSLGLICIMFFIGTNIYAQSAGCTAPSSSAYLDINNVRALIQNGGDMWWDLQGAAKYEVPKGSGKTSLFAGSIWIGGVDFNGQLIIAAQRFRQNGTDYWPGPLIASGVNQANTSQSVCLQYNQIYKITRKEVSTFRAWYNTPTSQRDSLFPNYTIPASIINWPAIGDINNNYAYYLAPFYDNNADGDYNVTDGDYPYFDLDGSINCQTDFGFSVKKLYGDLALWWVFNDNGNLHTETGGSALGIEVHAQAFAYNSNDEDINNTTFYNYDIINRSNFSYHDTYIGIWTDADLGDGNDDFLGCDVSRGLGYLYNGDAEDGNNGSPSWAYGINPPAVGIDFLRGPFKDANGIDDLSNWNNGTLDCNNGYRYDSISGNMIIAGTGNILNGNINGQYFGDNFIDNERIGMSHYIYFNGSTGGPSATQDPHTAVEHYNYLVGKWRDYSDLLYGGTGYASSATTTIPANFMFPANSDPCFYGTGGVDTSPYYPTGWTEESENNQSGDRRFLQSAGPFTMEAGEINDITLGVVWARSCGGHLQSVEALKLADDKIQKLFDNCFNLLELPDAPALTITPKNQQLDFNIWNYYTSNNYNDSYSKIDNLINCPSSNPQCDKTYDFQGYKVYQVKNSGVTIEQINDTSKAKLVYQCDKIDGISEITNYYYSCDTGGYYSVIEVAGANQGINHNFSITQNAFSPTNAPLTNFKKYYYMAIAYAYNNYLQFTTQGTYSLLGQKLQYIYSKNIKIFDAMPAPTGIVSNPNFGNEPEITQYDGYGCGSNFIDLKDETITKIMSGAPWKADTLKYIAGRGPIKVKVIDPLNVPIGEYEIKMIPGNVRKTTAGYYYYNSFFCADTLNYDINGYIADALWVLKDREGVVNTNPIGEIYSYSWISVNDLQVIPQLGLSIEIVQSPYSFPVEPTYAQQPEVSKIAPANNGLIYSSIEYSDPSKPWLKFMPDSDISDFRDWIKSGTNYTNPSSGDCNWYYNDRKITSSTTWMDSEQVFETVAGGAWAPYRLVSTFNHGSGDAGSISQIKSRELRLANVDLVITSDTSKWTRCPVLETTDNQYKLDYNGCTIQETAIANSSSEGLQKKLNIRLSPSVGKNGLPDNSGTRGMGWFPGYAIDIETGERLNLMFGESSRLISDNGKDMKWNPSARLATDLYWSSNGTAGEPIMGGKHFVYIMGHNVKFNTSLHKYLNLMKSYDGGDTLRLMLDSLIPQATNKRNAFMNCMWVGIPFRDTAYNYLACDVKIKLRVVSPYRKKIHKMSVANDTLGPNKGMPMYSFNTIGLVTSKNNSPLAIEIKPFVIYPNPSNGKFTIKINNALNADSKYDIYTLDGRLITSENISFGIKQFEIKNKGIYVIKVTDGKNVHSQKLIVF